MLNWFPYKYFLGSKTVVILEVTVGHTLCRMLLKYLRNVGVLFDSLISMCVISCPYMLPVSIYLLVFVLLYLLGSCQYDPKTVYGLYVE
jgi:hypothetical protein